MTAQWLKNPDATERVKSLLEFAGLPLEQTVADIASDFCAHFRAKDVHLSSDKIVYQSSLSESTYREVDQVLTIYEEFPVSKRLGIQLVVSTDIECKFRKDAEIFAFETNDKTLLSCFPVHSSLRGSSYFTLLSKSFTPFTNLATSNLALLEIKNGQTPQKMYEENVMHNAAGSLYDFILFDIAHDISSAEQDVDKIIDQLGIFNKFQGYLGKTHYPWLHIINEWMTTIKKKTHDEFAKHYFGGKQLMQSVHAHLPIVCTNGPIYKVAWTPNGGIETFHPISSCVTSIRKSGWPGRAFGGLLNRRAELPTIVTNPGGLKDVLNLGARWYESMREILTTASRTSIDRAPLEAGFVSKVSRFYARHETEAYRSDIYFEY